MKGENAHQRKRKLVYATSRNSDRNLDVLKRRRPPVLDQSDIQDEPLSDEERGDTPLSQIGGPCTLIRLPSLTSVPEKSRELRKKTFVTHRSSSKM